MSYLRFDKTLMTNLRESLPKEILRSNRSGAYSCTTLVDCNTRKYHGLLVVPVPGLDDENHVLLSSLDATVSVLVDISTSASSTPCKCPQLFIVWVVSS